MSERMRTCVTPAWCLLLAGALLVVGARKVRSRFARAGKRGNGGLKCFVKPPRRNAW